MINVRVSYATPESQVELPIQVEPSCTVAMAIRRSGILHQFPKIELGKVSVGINAKKVALDSRLHDGDRIEIYRSLLIDPKEARRRRA